MVERVDAKKKKEKEKKKEKKYIHFMTAVS